jgi:hypothetical protein
MDAPKTHPPPCQSPNGTTVASGLDPELEAALRGALADAGPTFHDPEVKAEPTWASVGWEPVAGACVTAWHCDATSSQRDARRASASIPPYPVAWARRCTRQSKKCAGISVPLPSTRTTRLSCWRSPSCWRWGGHLPCRVPLLVCGGSSLAGRWRHPCVADCSFTCCARPDPTRTHLCFAD